MAMTAVLDDLNLSIPEVAEKLDLTGFVCLENVVSPGWLEEARQSVNSSLAEYGEYDFCVINPNNQEGAPAHRFVTDQTVRALLEGLASARCPHAVTQNEQIYSVLRVLAGPEREASSFRFHYDAAIVTMLVPLFIPSAGAGKSGELVVFPNRRPFRGSVMANIFEKILCRIGFIESALCESSIKRPRNTRWC